MHIHHPASSTLYTFITQRPPTLFKHLTQSEKNRLLKKNLLSQPSPDLERKQGCLKFTVAHNSVHFCFSTDIFIPGRCQGLAGPRSIHWVWLSQSLAGRETCGTSIQANREALCCCVGPLGDSLLTASRRGRTKPGADRTPAADFHTNCSAGRRRDCLRRGRRWHVHTGPCLFTSIWCEAQTGGICWHLYLFPGCELMRVLGWASPCLLFVCAPVCQPPLRLLERLSPCVVSSSIAYLPRPWLRDCSVWQQVRSVEEHPDKITLCQLWNWSNVDRAETQSMP